MVHRTFSILYFSFNSLSPELLEISPLHTGRPLYYPQSAGILYCPPVEGLPNYVTSRCFFQSANSRLPDRWHSFGRQSAETALVQSVPEVRRPQSSTGSTTMPAEKLPLASGSCALAFHVAWWQSANPAPAAHAVHPETYSPPRWLAVFRRKSINSRCFEFEENEMPAVGMSPTAGPVAHVWRASGYSAVLSQRFFAEGTVSSFCHMRNGICQDRHPRWAQAKLHKRTQRIE